MTHRVSNDQLETLLEFLTAHPVLAKGVGLGARSKEAVDKQWNDLATKLNAFGAGSSKSGERWRKYWADIKHKTKARLAKRRRDALSTGGGPSSQEDLSEIDKKVLAIIGKQAVFGDIEHRVPVFSTQLETQVDTSVDNILIQEDPLDENEPDNIVGAGGTLPAIWLIPDVSTGAGTLPMDDLQRQRLTVIPDVSTGAGTLLTDDVPRQRLTETSPVCRPTTERRRRLRRTQPMQSSIDPQWVMELEQSRLEIERSRAESERKLAEAAMIFAEGCRGLSDVTRQLCGAITITLDKLLSKINS